jgi:hypothetical protein
VAGQGFLAACEIVCGVGPDADGLKNWQEFLHGSDGKDAASRGGLSWRVEGGTLVMTFTRRLGVAEGYEVRGRGSRDFLDWNAPDLQETVLATLDGIQSVEARLPLAGAQTGYLRAEYGRP